MNEDTPPPIPPPSPLGQLPRPPAQPPGFSPPPSEPRFVLGAKPEREPNLGLAVLGGLVAALLGAVIWAAIAVSTNSELGLVVIGLAFLVSVAVKFLGRGNSMAFGVVGAVCSLLGIVAGKVFILIWVISDHESISLVAALQLLDFTKLSGYLSDTFQPMDALFYCLALYCGFKYSLKR